MGPWALFSGIWGPGRCDNTLFQHAVKAHLAYPMIDGLMFMLMVAVASSWDGTHTNEF